MIDPHYFKVKSKTIIIIIVVILLIIVLVVTVKQVANDNALTSEMESLVSRMSGGILIFLAKAIKLVRAFCHIL